MLIIITLTQKYSALWNDQEKRTYFTSFIFYITSLVQCHWLYNDITDIYGRHQIARACLGLHFWFMIPNTVKPVSSDHSKRTPKIGFQDRLSLHTGQKYCKMLQESILQNFRPSLRYHLSLRPLFCLFLKGRLRQVLLYRNVNKTFAKFFYTTIHRTLGVGCRTPKPVFDIFDWTAIIAAATGH